ncbi:MAG TPA: type VI secretion system ImpA family N-terminal domain-containing protein [Sphingomicrobium sp.]|nr:type VI secretion system ImpA family N-terminal domain-containing protein [Sphingomicrobium sp.]
MEAFDFSALIAPVSDSDPCGPDLELADDLEFMQFMARAEGLLPSSFFAFDRSSIDFTAEFVAIKKLLGDALDLRPLSVLAKLLVLNRDLPGFASCVAGIGSLLSERWDEVHPRGEDGDFGMRMAVLQSLDDLPPVVLPLQHVPLAESRRFGPITYRSYLLATGEAKPRENEQVLDRSTIEGAFMEADLPRLVETANHLRSLQTALGGIRATCVAKVGHEKAVSFDNLGPVAGNALAVLESIIVKRDPSGVPKAAAPEPSAETAVQAGKTTRYQGLPSLGSTREAAAALAAAAAYFRRFEPSNPAVLLVRQAEELMGKSFMQVMRILMPNQAEQATIQIRGAHSLDLPIERLSTLISDPSEVEEPARENGSDCDGAHIANGAGERSFQIRTRDDAIALLVQVGNYYRLVEPSSPVPLLTERALSLAECDFLGLLKDLLPETPKEEQSSEFAE